MDLIPIQHIILKKKSTRALVTKQRIYVCKSIFDKAIKAFVLAILFNAGKNKKN